MTHTIAETPPANLYIETALSVLENQANALVSMKSCLDDVFVNIIQKILNTQGRVIITGMGKSGHIAKKIAATLASTGQPALFVHPAEASHGDMGMITEHDIILALSNSGETRELADIIEYAKRYSIPLIGMTRSASSSLSKLSDYSLVIPNAPEACAIGLAPTTSTTMMLVMGDAIAVTLLKARGFNSTDFRVFHPGGNLGGKLRKVGEQMHTGDLVPVSTSEVPVSSIILTMSSKGFGCVGIVNDQGLLIGIITDGDLRRHMQSNLLEQTAAAIMTKNPFTLDESMLMNEALALLNDRKITASFVVKDQKPVGIIHLHDFLRAGIA